MLIHRRLSLIDSANGSPKYAIHDDGGVYHVAHQTSNILPADTQECVRQINRKTFGVPSHVSIGLTQRGGDTRASAQLWESYMRKRRGFARKATHSIEACIKMSWFTFNMPLTTQEGRGGSVDSPLVHLISQKGWRQSYSKDLLLPVTHLLSRWVRDVYVSAPLDSNRLRLCDETHGMHLRT